MKHIVKDHEMDTTPHDADNNVQPGLTAMQWTLLFFAFALGIASVFTLDKTVLAKGPGASNSVQAAVAAP